MRLLLVLLLSALGGASCGTERGSSGADLAIQPPDQAVVVDLAVPPDLAPVLDFAEEPPDLVTPPDLTVPRDLARPVDLAQGGGNCLGGAPCPGGLVCCNVGRNAGLCYDPRCLACCM